MCYRNTLSRIDWTVRSLATVLLMFFALGVSSADAAELAFDMERSKSGGIRAPLDVLGEEDCTAATSRGCDYSDQDDRIRINDIAEATFSYSVNDGDADQVTITSELPTGLRWKFLPAYCRTGSSLTGTGEEGEAKSKIVCNRGLIEEGTAEELRFQIRVLGSNLDGATFSVKSVLSAVDHDSIESESFNLIATGKPRYNLRLRYYSWGRYAANPEVNNDYGVIVYYRVELLIDPANGKGPVGTEDLNGDDLTYTLDIGDNWPDGARLWHDHNSWCQAHYLYGGPYSRITGGYKEDRAVIEAGQFECSQPGGPDTPIIIKVKGIDTSGSTTPELSYHNTPLSADDHFVGVGRVAIWVPNTELTGTYIPVTSTFRKFTATAKSGGAIEERNLDDNTVTTNINNPPPCRSNGGCWGYRKYIHYRDPVKVGTWGVGAVPNYTNYNDGSITVGPGQISSTRLYFYTSNADGHKNVQMCDKIDNTVINFKPFDDNPDTAAYLVFQHGADLASPYTIEWAADSSFGPGVFGEDWKAQAEASCTDDDGPWYTDIRDVPGGILAVNKVRVTIPDHKPGNPPHFYNYLSLMIRTQAKESGVPTGTPLVDYSGVRVDGHNNDAWRFYTTYNPINHSSYNGWSDRLLYTNAIVRNLLYSGTNNTIDAVVSGEDVAWRITPKATPPSGSVVSGALKEVFVTSTFSKGLSYQPGSSYVDGKLFEPETITNNDDGTQTVVWVFRDVPLDRVMPHIDMKTDIAFNVLDGTKLTHTNVIYSEGDSTPERYRTRSRSVVASSPEGLRVFKKAHKKYIRPGEKIIFTIAYANLSTTLDFTKVDVIDVLPYKGDERKPPSTWDGVFELEGITSESQMVTFYYTKHAPEQMDLDPNHAMHQPGGAVRWCTADEIGAVAACPANMAEITGIRLTDVERLPVGSDARYATMTFKTANNKYHNTYTNRMGGRVPEIDKVVRSPHVFERVITGTVGGRLFEDNNEDGTHQVDGNEGGVAGVRLKLVDATGATAKDEDGNDLIVTSDADGHYLFTKVIFGEYRVVVDAGQDALNGYSVSAVNVADPNNDVRYDNNAVKTNGTGSQTGLVNLEIGKEPINDDYADTDEFSLRDQDSNITLDLGYVPPPKVGIAKSATTATSNGDGTFTSTITLTIKNLGQVAAPKLRVTDDIRDKFPQAVTFTVAELSNASGALNGNLNSQFNGESQTSLLVGDYTLPVGATEVLTFKLIFSPKGERGPFFNQAKVTSSTDTLTVEDLSDNGTNPDTDNDKRANEDGTACPSTAAATNCENDPTPVNYQFSASIGLAKAATAATSNGDGTFTSRYTLKVQNLGDVPVNNVQVEDNIRSQFPGAVNFTIANIAATGDLQASVNTSFDGNLGNDGSQPSDINMLDGTATLAVGKTETITFDLTFTPNGVAGPFNNSAKVTGDVVGDAEVEDISDNGAVTDANNNKNANEAGENDPTPVNYSATQVVGLAKSASAITANGDGSFTTVISLKVQNLGDVPLTEVKVEDNLSNTFPAEVDYKVETLRNTSGNWNGQLNLAFEADTRDQANQPSTWVVVNNAELGVNAIEIITFKLTFWPHHQPSPFNNSATVSGKGPTATPADVSDNGTNVDANGNKNPNENGENDPTPLPYAAAEQAAIGIAKSATKAEANDDGSFTTTIRIIVKNIGNVDLHDVLITDDLRSVFPQVATYEVSNVRIASAAAAASLETGFNGNTQRNLIKAPGLKLAVGETQDIRFEIKFVPNGAVPPFYNQAETTAKSPNNAAVTDKSDNGTVIDGNDNKQANDATGNCPNDDDISGCEDDPTPIDFDGTPIIALAKAATEALTNNDGTFTSTITLVVENLGNVPLNQLRIEDPIKTNFPAGVDFSISDLTSVSGNLTANLNNNFNGDTDVNILTGDYQLKYEQQETITFKLTITPNGKPSPFMNRAIAKGTGPGDNLVTDVSDNGSKPDPDGDGDPTEGSGLCPSDIETSNCENDPTPIPYTSNDVIGVSKSAGRVVAGEAGWFSTYMTITVENLGDAPLTEVMVSDDIRAQYPTAVAFKVSELSSVGGAETANLNTRFDGDTGNTGSSASDINLLSNPIDLAVDEKQAFRFKIEFQPGYEVGPFFNQAVANGRGPSGTTRDLSDNGNVTDPNDNMDPTEVGEDDPTPVDYDQNEAPAIRIFKGMTEATTNGDGSFTSTVELKVFNSGNVNLKNVRVEDDIRAQFPAAVRFEVSDLQSVSGNWATALVDGFDGSTQTQLLQANSARLATGAMERLTFKLRIWPATEKGPFNNQAVARGQSPNDKDVDALSEDGVPPPNARITGEPQPKPSTVPYTPSPAVGIAKQATRAASNGNGTFTSTFTLVVENLGDVDLTELQVEDNIRTHFPQEVTFSVANLRSISGNLTNHLNAGFDGNGADAGSQGSDIFLLDGTFVLGVGKSEALAFEVTFNPNGLSGPFFNSALVTAKAIDEAVQDRSDNGGRSDPDGDGNASETNANCPSTDLSSNCEDDPTPVDYSSTEQIGVAKQAGTVVANGDGSFTAPMTVVVENLGDVPLKDVMVSDNIRGQYPTGVRFTVSNLRSPDGVLVNWLNLDFDGDQTDAGSTPQDINLLSANAKLAYGQRAVLTFDITFWPGLNQGPFFNQIVAGGNGPHGYTEDLSDNGSEPDANGNDVPSDANEDDPTPVDYRTVAAPVIGAAKRVGDVTANGDGSFNVTFTMIVENIGNVTLKDVGMTEALRAQLPAALQYQVTNLRSLSGRLTPALNANFNGDTDQTIISENAGVVLQPADKEEVSFDLRFWPNGEAGPFNNQVRVAAKSPYDQATDDLSDNGDQTDSNNNGVANEAVDNDPTPYDYRGVAQASIALAKRAGPVTALDDGRFWTIMTMKVENVGNTDLLDVNIDDHILSQYPAAVDFVVSEISSVSGNLTNKLRTDFNGKAVRQMLQAGVTLKPGDVEEISFKLTFEPHAEAGPFYNQGTASGQGPTGRVTDLSDDGTQPDPNGNGKADDANEDDPTPVDYLGGPNAPGKQALGIAKSATAATSNDDGTFSTVIVLTVENLGNTEVRNVQVSDNIRDRFPTEVTFTVSDVTSVGGNMTNVLNAGFDGENDFNVTNDQFLLKPGQREQIRFVLRIAPNGKLGPFENQAVVTGKGPSKDLRDLSDNGTNPDPNDNGDPSDNRGTCPSDNANDECEDDPTPITYTADATPAMGIAKAAGVTRSNNNGSFTTPFTVTVSNLGDVQLDHVKLVDDIRSRLPAAMTFEVMNLQSLSGDFTPNLNAAFDGNANTSLLDDNATLKVGETQQISFDLVYYPNGVYGPFQNVVLGTASGAGKDVNDISDNGDNPDTNRNRVGNEDGENDPTPYDYADAARPAIGLAKEATDIVANGDGTFSTSITLRVKNLGDIALNSLQITDDIRQQLPADVTFVVDNLISVGGNLTNHLNADFDGGIVNADLLDGLYQLPFGAEEAVRFDLTFNPHGVHGPFTNQAVAKGEGPKGFVDDKSDDGDKPDPNNNGRGDDAGEDDPTPIDYHDAASPVIGIAKMAEEATSNRDGSFSTTVTLVIENLGDVVLHNLQVTDHIRQQFPAEVDIAISDLRSVSGVLTNHLNQQFDGGQTAGNDALLDARYSMKVGDTEQLTFVLTFTPHGEGGPFSNSAQAEGTGPKGPVTDISDAGAKPDPDNDGNPTETNPTCRNNPDAAGCENDPTPIVYTGNPAISILKRASDAQSNWDGSFTNTITLNIRNMGDVKLLDVKVTDDIRAAFPADVRYEVSAVQSGSGNYTRFINPQFNGDAHIDLLIDDNGVKPTLDVGKDETLLFNVTFWPETHRGPFLNQAKTTAVGPGAKPVDDISDSGANHDPDGDGNPNETGNGCSRDPDGTNCENDPTPMPYTPHPAVSAAKDGRVEGTGPYTVTYDFVLSNVGDVLLTDVQATDDLVATFGQANVNYKVLNLTYQGGPGHVAVNPEFNGNPDADAGGDVNLLAAGSKLYPGEEARVQATIKVYLVGQYDNQIDLFGTGPGRETVTDKSDFGLTITTYAKRVARETSRAPKPNCQRQPEHPDCEDDPTPVALRVGDSADPFVCDDEHYISTANGAASDVNRLIRATNPMSLLPVATRSDISLDALGFRFTDRYQYALEAGTSILWRIDALGGFVFLGVVTDLPYTLQGYVAGSFSVDGTYWVYGAEAETLYQIDVDQVPPRVINTVAVAGLGNIGDIAFQPRTNELFTYNSDRNELIKIDTANGNLTVVGNPTNGIGEVGALWFNGFGSLLGYEQASNSHVTFNLANGEVSLTALQSSTSTPVDGASCPYAPGVLKLATPEEVEVGMVGTYQFLISNPHPTETFALTLRDTLGDGRVWVADSLSDDLGGQANNYGGTATLEVANMSLAPNALVAISVDMKLPFDYQQIGQTLFNQAHLSGMPEEFGGPSTPSDYPLTAHGPDATPILVKANSGCEIEAYVYGDENHNGDRDDGESAAGDNLCVNIHDSAGALVDSVATEPVNGLYRSKRLEFGDYVLKVGLLTGPADAPSCDTSSLPQGYLLTEPDIGEWPLRVDNRCIGNGGVIRDPDFGLFKGIHVKGTVFVDNGHGGATANNGRQEAGEPGINRHAVTAGSESGEISATVTALCNNGVCGTTQTNAGGHYEFWLGAGQLNDGETVIIREDDPVGYLSTGGNVGNTNGQHDRGAGTTAFKANFGNRYTNVDFGDIPPNTFNNDQSTKVVCGTPALYGHVYTATSAGRVSFSGVVSMISPQQDTTGFTHLFWWDGDCNGQMDDDPFDLTQQAVMMDVDTATEAVEQLCIIAQVNTPNCVPHNTQVVSKIDAAFDYDNTDLSSTLSVSDTTRISAKAGGDGRQLSLQKSVLNLTTGVHDKAAPCDVLEYRINFVNPTNQAVPGLVIRDDTPAYTKLSDAPVCPTGMTAAACDAEISNGGIGAHAALAWQFNRPIQAGETGFVSYKVQLDSVNGGACQ